MANPMWVGERVFFVCDPAGCGNLFSVTLHGFVLFYFFCLFF
jgi:tricorn protease-like protein